MKAINLKLLIVLSLLINFQAYSSGECLSSYYDVNRFNEISTAVLDRIDKVYSDMDYLMENHFNSDILKSQSSYEKIQFLISTLDYNIDGELERSGDILADIHYTVENNSCDKSKFKLHQLSQMIALKNYYSDLNYFAEIEEEFKLSADSFIMFLIFKYFALDDLKGSELASQLYWKIRYPFSKLDFSEVEWIIFNQGFNEKFDTVEDFILLNSHLKSPEVVLEYVSSMHSCNVSSEICFRFKEYFVNKFNNIDEISKYNFSTNDRKFIYLYLVNPKKTIALLEKAGVASETLKLFKKYVKLAGSEIWSVGSSNKNGQGGTSFHFKLKGNKEKSFSVNVNSRYFSLNAVNVDTSKNDDLDIVVKVGDRILDYRPGVFLNKYNICNDISDCRVTMTIKNRKSKSVKVWVDQFYGSEI
ncbi:hypothetical protein [Halobacteriovorax sp. HLS]|uniref:hypothetical protein n=1 Tax=Halobacteriovorax sp. HLS TaxID=2234000 RepID=UPI000FD9BE7A|nr:hypothetical protein [Halobacteriovorax sp. HLS]